MLRYWYIQIHAGDSANSPPSQTPLSADAPLSSQGKGTAGSQHRPGRILCHPIPGNNAYYIYYYGGWRFLFKFFFLDFLVQPFPFLSLVIMFRVGVGVRIPWRRTGNRFHARWGELWAIFVNGLENHNCPLLLHGLCRVHPVHQPTVVNPVIFPPDLVMMASASFGVYVPWLLLIPIILVLMINRDDIMFSCMVGYCLQCLRSAGWFRWGHSILQWYRYDD